MSRSDIVEFLLWCGVCGYCYFLGMYHGMTKIKK